MKGQEGWKTGVGELLPALLNVGAAVATLVVSLTAHDTMPFSGTLLRALGLAGVYGGLAFAAWATFHLGAAVWGLVSPRLDHFVLTGPYRLVRHPIYVGTAVAVIGVALVARSWLGLGMGLLVFIPSEIHRARREEAELKESFGEAWNDYSARTPSFLPRLPPYGDNGH